MVSTDDHFIHPLTKDTADYALFMSHIQESFYLLDKYCSLLTYDIRTKFVLKLLVRTMIDQLQIEQL